MTNKSIKEIHSNSCFQFSCPCIEKRQIIGKVITKTNKKRRIIVDRGETFQPISLCWRCSTSQRAEIADCLTRLAPNVAVWEVLLTETCHVATGERHCFGWYSATTGDHVLLFLVCVHRGKILHIYPWTNLFTPWPPIKAHSQTIYIHTHNLTPTCIHTHSAPVHTHIGTALALLSLTPFEMTLWPLMTPKREGSWDFSLDLCVPAVAPLDTSISFLKGGIGWS